MTDNLFDLRKKRIAFTGATGVLGTQMSKFLAKKGAELAILGRNQHRLDKLAEEITQEGGVAHTYRCDVCDWESVQTAAELMKQDFDNLDILINAAGGNMPGAVVSPEQSFLDVDIASLKNVMDLNYLGTVLPIKALLPLMLPSQKGNIITISSMAASRPMTRVMGYASAKAAIDNLTKWLAVELASKHGPDFRVNALAPGFFLTEQNRSLLTHPDQTLTQRGTQILAHTPMNRFGKPEDLLGALQWLCSDASSFVTGTIVAVDGGFSAYSGV